MKILIKNTPDIFEWFNFALLDLVWVHVPNKDFSMKNRQLVRSAARNIALNGQHYMLLGALGSGKSSILDDSATHK